MDGYRWYLVPGRKRGMCNGDPVAKNPAATSVRNKNETEGEQERNAPKISKTDCKVDWSLGTGDIHNFIRGLSPYPTAFSSLLSPDGKVFSIKINRNPVITKSTIGY